MEKRRARERTRERERYVYPMNRMNRKAPVLYCGIYTRDIKHPCMFVRTFIDALKQIPRR